MSGALARLAAALQAQGGLVAGCLRAEPARTGGAGLAAWVASGPRAAASAGEYELVIEAIREGYLLHYGGGGRLVASEDPDLALLAGDLLYALGLERLIALGDLAAVAELADVIALAAIAQSDGDGALAEAVWEAGGRAVGWGSDAAHAEAKASARRTEAAATGLLRAFAKAPADIVRPPSDLGSGPQES